MANHEHLTVLNQGIRVWNAWRRENPEINPDLSLANLRKANLRSADFRGVDLVGAKLGQAEIGQALLGGADLSGADLAGADLRLVGVRVVDAERLVHEIEAEFGADRFVVGAAGELDEATALKRGPSPG